MNVGVLTSVHSALDVRIYHKECRSLARAGHAVTIIAPHPRDEVIDGVSIRAVEESARGRLARMTETVYRVAREAFRLDAEVYHIHDPELIPLALLLRRRGKLVIYDAHEDLPQTIVKKRYIPPLARKPVEYLSRALELLAARQLTAIVAATPTIGQHFAAINPLTAVVRNYVSLEEWGMGNGVPWADRPCAVTYVGAITLDRGLREMVAAMGILSAEIPARLALAGPRSATLMAEVQQVVPGWQQVDDLGILDRPAIVDLLGRMRAGLVLLHPTPSYVPSLPIKLFEYMAAGLPVVASDFPVMRGIIERAGCGLLVNPLDPSAIAEAIRFLLQHPDQADSMGRRGRAAVEQQYSWESEAQTLLRLYGDLEAKRPSVSRSPG
jgi:glycosyltransferase involved in cell wall biosynthesis